MNGRIIALLIVFISVFLSSCLDTTIMAEEERNCLYNSDFESGTLEDWGVMGSCDINLDSGLTHDGSGFSMSVSDRNMSWEGPTVNLLPYVVNDDESRILLKKGEYYTISGFLYAISDKDDEEPVRCTIKYNTTEGGANYLSVSDITVPPNQWVEVYGTVQIPDTELTTFDLYYEAYSEYLSFNIDSFKIMEATESEKSDEPVTPAVDVEEEYKNYSFAAYRNDFESGVIEPFKGAYNSTLSIDSIDGHKCMKISERAFDYSGPSIYLNTVFKEYDTYLLTLYVYFESDVSYPFKATIIYNEPNGEKQYKNIAYSDNFKSGEWNLIQNKIVFNETLSSPELIIETEGEGGNIDFYIDDFSITSKTDHKIDNNVRKDDKSDFENGIDDFQMYEVASAVRDNSIGYKSKSSLKVSKRGTQNSGVFKFINFVKKDKKYLSSAYILSEGKDCNDIQMKISYVQNGVPFENVIAAEKADSGKWTKISGVFSIPDDSYSVMLIFNSPDNSLISDFYLDQVTIEDYDQYVKKVHHRNTLIVINVSLFAAVIVIVLIICIRTKKQKLKVINASNIDEMTKAYTRNAFQKELEKYAADPEKYKNIFVTACDVNGLKMINDTCGHSFGDEAIKRCSNVLRSVIGKKGSVYRTGGDEFVCLTTEDLTENLITALKKEAGYNMGYPFSAAVGCSSYDDFSDDEAPDFEKILKKADQKMFDNKSKMKNDEKPE